MLRPKMAGVEEILNGNMALSGAGSKAAEQGIEKPKK